MRIHDTLDGKKKEVRADKAGIYLCGVTVYDEAHIGHARTIIVFDVLRRHLESRGTEVRLVQNFTDVDDKIIERARSEGTSAQELSARYIRAYHAEFGRLGVRRASEYPLATEHMPEILELIKSLVGSGSAYAAPNGVYFSVSGFPRYGSLSRNTGGLISGARVGIDAGKRDPTDFALWKLSRGDPSWESPWGRGRPGWHIECSAMCLKYLGETFEIHGGGRDLIFPHHENEMAQSEAHTGRRLAKIWMHVGMVTIDGEKMSKSLGNMKSVRFLLERWSPGAMRIFCIAGHYSKPVDYSEELLEEHETFWERARLAYHVLVQGKPAPGGDDTAGRLWAEFGNALDDDLNTHLALDAFRSLVSYCLGGPKDSELLRIFDAMLGVLGLEIPVLTGGERTRVEGLISERARLRGNGLYDEADHIRDNLASKGITLQDGPEGTIWILSEPAPADINRKNV
ncbi:cysteinyl-tRNA synthetase [Cenarchaeum symbiosum A]|uniref:Cysteine--tRNA ligase n=1 Tax=Cenarchaeum symbiosum (strain A) TaxID=414004 RepID=A0RXA0_CENSY|nr:cysteinyl-tRNA synthetase [Cenarchaeum symbiosum A]